jgi:hypothetical protein
MQMTYVLVDHGISLDVFFDGGVEASKTATTIQRRKSEIDKMREAWTVTKAALQNNDKGGSQKDSFIPLLAKVSFNLYIHYHVLCLGMCCVCVAAILQRLLA